MSGASHAYGRHLDRNDGTLTVAIGYAVAAAIVRYNDGRQQFWPYDTAGLTLFHGSGFQP